MRSTICKRRQSYRSALVVSLVVLFWAAQLLPPLAGPVFCHMKSSAGHHDCPGVSNHHGRGCCCGDADAHNTGLKNRCCEARQTRGSSDQDFAVSLVPNVSTQDSHVFVAESPSTARLDLFTGSPGALDWVKSKSLSKPIYLTNLNFLC